MEEKDERIRKVSEVSERNTGSMNSSEATTFSNTQKEPKKNTNKAWMILALVFGILFLGAAGFIVFDEIISKKDNCQRLNTEQESVTNSNGMDDGNNSEKSYYATQILPEGQEQLNTFWMEASELVTAYATDEKIQQYLIQASQSDDTRKNFRVTVAEKDPDAEIYRYLEDAELRLAFDDEVRTIIVVSKGQDVIPNPVLLFIFVNGKVKYINLTGYDATRPLEIGDLDGVSGIVGATEANAFLTNGHTGGYHTTLLQRIDGRYYDLLKVFEALEP